MSFEVLENPVWASLAGPHSQLAIRSGQICRYPANITPFIAVSDAADRWERDLLMVVDKNEEVVLMDSTPDRYLRSFICVKTSVADQMVYGGGGELSNCTPDIQLIGESFSPAMVELTNIAFPGYFRIDTPKLGRYAGIFSESRLVAMAGERLRPSHYYQELSGICTDPLFRGRGYAKNLTSWVAREALKENRIPFLHVNSENISAIRVYERLGFKKRRTFVIRRLRRLTE